MQFVASLTRQAYEIRKIRTLWEKSGDPRNPLARVLITPLFTPPSTLKLVREMRESGIIQEVCFDSGGYFVQMGRISFEEMYWQLLSFYRENDWADWYVLPDYVPTSSDTPEDVWYKVQTTADGSALFYQEMPASLQEKALPVVQGHTVEQIEFCLKKYLELSVQRIGFGSFGTNGKASSVNAVTENALGFLVHLKGILDSHQIHLHAFGVGTPPVIYLLNEVGVNSFDSVGWMKTAGYGKIYMPFVRAYNVTYRDPLARGMKERDFSDLKIITGHECYFCRSFQNLVDNRFARIMHNLIVLLDTVQLLEGDLSYVPNLLASYSPFYAKLQGKTLQ